MEKYGQPAAAGAALEWGVPVSYGCIGSMRTEPGRRDEVVAILLDGVERLRAAGCSLYVVNVSNTEDDMIWVNEIWQSKEHHDSALQLPETEAAIGRARPLLTGQVTSREVTVVGGLGL